jgi:hypothetical protein
MSRRASRPPPAAASLFERDIDEVSDDDAEIRPAAAPRFQRNRSHPPPPPEDAEMSPPAPVAAVESEADASMRELEKANRVKEAAARAARAASAAAKAHQLPKPPLVRKHSDGLAMLDSILNGPSSEGGKKEWDHSDKEEDDDEEDLTQMLLSPKERKKLRLQKQLQQGKGKQHSEEPASLWVPKSSSGSMHKASSSAASGLFDSPDPESDPFAFITAGMKRKPPPTAHAAAGAKKQKAGNGAAAAQQVIDLSDDESSIGSVDALHPSKAKGGKSAAVHSKGTVDAITLGSDDDDEPGAKKSALLSSSSDDEEAIAREMKSIVKQDPGLSATLASVRAMKMAKMQNQKSLELSTQQAKQDPCSMPSPVKPPTPPKIRSFQAPAAAAASSAHADAGPPGGASIASLSARSSYLDVEGADSEAAPPILPLASSSAVPVGPSILNFWVNGSAASKFRKRFKVFSNTKFEMIRDKLLSSLKASTPGVTLGPANLVLRFDGRKIGLADTPQSIGLEEGEQVDMEVVT